MVNNFVEQFWKLMKGGGSHDEARLRRAEREYLLSMCRDVRAEKDRLGGDWAVASVIRTREERDIMRSVLYILTPTTNRDHSQHFYHQQTNLHHHGIPFFLWVQKCPRFLIDRFKLDSRISFW